MRAITISIVCYTLSLVLRPIVETQLVKIAIKSNAALVDNLNKALIRKPASAVECYKDAVVQPAQFILCYRRDFVAINAILGSSFYTGQGGFECRSQFPHKRILQSRFRHSNPLILLGGDVTRALSTGP